MMEEDDQDVNREAHLQEIRALVEADPKVSGSFASFELTNGRLEWLAYHIRACDFHIEPNAAKALLRLLDGSHPELALKIVRKPCRNPKSKPRLETDLRDFGLALEVAKRGGFKHAHLTRVCHAVGLEQNPPLEGRTVRGLIKPWKEFALSHIENP